jgi:hypothetical protein
LVVGSFAAATACGSSDEDDGSADASTTATGFGGANGATANTSNTANNNSGNNNSGNNNSGSGTTGDVLMHDDTECMGQDPVDGEACETEGLVCHDDDGSLCACGQVAADEWTCLDFGTNGGGGQAGGGGEGGAR